MVPLSVANDRLGGRPVGSRWALLLLSLVACLVLVAVLRVAFTTGLSADEVEHAHVTWALGEGVAPFQDHRQNHMPTLYLLFRGLFAATDSAASTVLVARGICLAAWGVAIFFGVLVLREALPRPRSLEIALMSVVAAAGVIPLQGYRFRPDPFMAMFLVAAIWAATRLEKEPWRHAGLCGVFTGLAAAFSLKMGLVCLLVPLLSLEAVRRVRSWRPLAWGPVAFLGFCLGIAPTVVWIWQAGHLRAWFRTVVAHNLRVMNASEAILETLSHPIVCMALLATVVVLVWRRGSRGASSFAGLGLLVGGVLTLGIVPMASSHLTYNLQGFAVPGACLLSLAIGRVVERLRHRWLRLLVIAGVLAGILYEPLRTARTLETEGSTASVEDVSYLQQLVTGDDECFAFVPMHPIRCRNAARVFLGWDLFTPLRTTLTESARAHYRRLWNRTLDEVCAEKPRLIVLPRRFKAMYREGLIGRLRSESFQRMLNEEYRYLSERNEARVYVRR